ncbi:MAG: hypothetical protein OEY59_05310 [Deltaproteobacteria bacterium]|nr:hypothetical protein [Deltaproteobacteria bacterium]
MKLNPTAFGRLYLTSFILAMLMLAGCATPLEKGWSLFSEGKYNEAREAWAKDHPKLLSRIDAAEAMVKYYNQLLDVEKTKDNHKILDAGNKVIDQDKFKNKEWLQKSPTLTQYLAYATKARDKALEIIHAKASKEFDESYNCGKEKFGLELYKDALNCFEDARVISEKYPSLSLIKLDMDGFVEAAKQAIEIAAQIEEEIKRFEAEKREAIEEERKLEEERRKKAEAEIQVAKAAERQRLLEEEEKRRVEEEKKRKWMAFLQKGKPFRPLVAAIGIPTKGHGKLAIGKTEKWQGGAAFPAVKKLKLKAEDVFSLEMVIPRKFELTYLRNYSTAKGNMMKIPQTIGQNKHYYSEGYKGGRFYTEIKNTRDENPDYEIKGIIYKVPVIH